MAKTKNKKLILIGLAGILLFSGLMVLTLTQVAGAKDEAATIKLNIGIPKPGGGDIVGEVKDMFEYIGLIYQYGVSIAGILAAVMIIWGAFDYITSTGNPSKVQKAKDEIISAIIGLVLALGSYSLLYLINPNLVSFSGLGVENVERYSPFCEFGASKKVYNASGGEVTKPNDAICGTKYYYSSTPSSEECYGSYCNMRDCIVYPQKPNSTYKCQTRNDITYECISNYESCTNNFYPNPNIMKDSNGKVTTRMDCFSEETLPSTFCTISTTSSCVYTFVSCPVNGCSDYKEKISAKCNSGDIFDEDEGEVSALPITTIPKIFETLCEANPCEIDGGCEFSAKNNVCLPKS